MTAKIEQTPRTTVQKKAIPTIPLTKAATAKPLVFGADGATSLTLCVFLALALLGVSNKRQNDDWDHKQDVQET